MYYSKSPGGCKDNLLYIFVACGIIN
jgi:hypothetical protein